MIKVVIANMDSTFVNYKSDFHVVMSTIYLCKTVLSKCLYCDKNLFML